MARPVRFYLPLEEIQKIKDNIIEKYAGMPFDDAVRESIEWEISIAVDQLFKKLGYVK